MPHIVPPGATLFITFRLACSLPAAVTQQLQEELEVELNAIREQLIPAEERIAAASKVKKAYFGKFDAQLDAHVHGPDGLLQSAVAEMIKLEIVLLVELEVKVLSYCIMPNHVHLVVQLPESSDFSLGS